MDLQKQLLAEASVRNIQFIAELVKNDPACFNELFQYIYSNNGYLATRAGWVIDHLLEARNDEIKSKLNEIIDFLPHTKFHGLRRHLLKIVSCFPYPDYKMAEMIDLCFSWLNSTDQKVAAKVHCMQILYNISEKEPELLPELVSTLENLYELNSTGFQCRANKIINKANKRI